MEQTNQLTWGELKKRYEETGESEMIIDGCKITIHEFQENDIESKEDEIRNSLRVQLIVLNELMEAHPNPSDLYDKVYYMREELKRQLGITDSED